MPTVLILGGVRVVIYTSDHRPAHVHAVSGGNSAVFLLNCPAGPVELRENRGFSRPKVNKLAKALQAHVSGLCQEWSKRHGDF